MFLSWNDSFISAAFSFDGYHRLLESQLTNLQHRVQNWTWFGLFYLFTYFLAVHAFTRSFQRLYCHGMAYLRQKRKPLIVRRPRRVVRRNKMERPAPEESADNDSNKPIWRPKPKKKHRRKPRQGW